MPTVGLWHSAALLRPRPSMALLRLRHLQLSARRLSSTAVLALQGGDAAPAPPAPAAFTTSPPTHGGTPPVDPPLTVPWSGRSNHVRITGSVLREVTSRTISKLGGQPVSTMSLGLQAGYGTEKLGSVLVEGFGHRALQMAQHLAPGMTVTVEGHLRQDRWKDAVTGQPRSMVKVVVEELQIVEGGGGHEAEASGFEATAAHEHAQQQPADVQQPADGAAAGAGVQPRAHKAPQSTPSAQHSYQLYQNEGMAFEAIAEQRRIKASTVVTHVLTEVALDPGKPFDWQRAASELQMGPPGSPWLTMPEVAEAIAAAAEAAPGTPLLQLSLSAIRAELEHNVVTGAKLAALEALCPDKTLTYGVIRLGLAAQAHDLDPLEVVRHPPSPLQPLPRGPPPF